MNHRSIPLWQTPEWEDFQKSLGHHTNRIEDNLILIYPLFLGLKYGYIPRGPVNLLRHWELFEAESEEERGNRLFFSKLMSFAKKHHLIFARIDPEQHISIPRNIRTIPSHSPQPETTLILDLTLSEEDLLKQMKRKGRYNISLAEKKGVVVRMAKSKEERQAFAKIFHELMTHTTQRDRFSAHDESYYQKMLESLPSAEIFVAFFEEKPLSAAICTFQAEHAIYYYGASGNEHRELMSPYLVQWEAIKEAKKRGCKTYDFLGIAPENADSNHPWKGITEFKTKFGGSVVTYPKAQDLIFKPFWYKIYQFLKFIQKRIKS